MCDECKGVCGASDSATVNGQSHSIVAYGPETPFGPFKVVQNSAEHLHVVTQAAIHKQLLRIARQTYNTSRPLDEYAGVNSPPPLNVSWLAEYAITVRVESILASLPVGITSATLQLGQRYIPMYNGPATTAQLLWNPQGLGIILGESDNRAIVFTGAPTSGYFVQLSGYALERDGDR
jgi:hypothetical protein